MLLRDVPVSPAAIERLIKGRTVLVLGDVTLPVSAPPLAAVAYLMRAGTGTAELAGIGVSERWRRQGLGRRLLTSAATALRATGVDRVAAWAVPGSAGALLLADAGFIADNDVGDNSVAGPGLGRTRDRSRFTLLL
jgi:GNAT superfamily N-acetyltransferase